MKNLTPALLLVTASIPAIAQTSTTAAVPTIEVIAEQSSGIAKQTGSVVIIDRQSIDAIQPLSTEDILRRIPGINITSEEETSIIANFGIRGLPASESKSLLLEDGVPVSPGLFVGNDRYFNPRIQRVESVEVLKGSSSLRYGPSTIGGVVNYQTKTPEDVSISTRLGSFNTREVSVEAGSRTPSGEGYGGLLVTQARSDGFMDKGYEMTDVMIKSGIQLDDDQQFGMKFSFYENEANISYRGLLLDDYKAGKTYNPAPDDYYLTDRKAFDLNHAWDLSESTSLKTVAYWSEVTRDYWRYDVDTAESNNQGRWVYEDTLTGNNRSFERVGIESRLFYNSGITENEFGLRLMQEKSDDKRIRATKDQDRTGVNDRHRQDSAFSYAAHTRSRVAVSERWAITPGLRIEHYKQKRVVLTQQNDSASTSNTEFLPGVGTTFEVSNSAQFFGGLYRAFAPASNGVALDGLTDQELKGERSNNLEIGIRGYWQAMTYELAAFQMDFSNQVVTGNSDPNLSQSNAGETIHRGAELSLGFELGAGFSLDTNATWVPDSRFETGDDKGNRLPYSPKYLANIALGYGDDRLSTTLTAHRRGSQFGDGENTRDIPNDAASGIWGGEIPSYTVYDLMTQYAATPNLRLSGAIKNLTDKQYISGLRQGIYVGPERSFELGFRITL